VVVAVFARLANVSSIFSVVSYIPLGSLVLLLSLNMFSSAGIITKGHLLFVIGLKIYSKRAYKKSSDSDKRCC